MPFSGSQPHSLFYTLRDRRQCGLLSPAAFIQLGLEPRVEIGPKARVGQRAISNWSEDRGRADCVNIRPCRLGCRERTISAPAGAFGSWNSIATKRCLVDSFNPNRRGKTRIHGGLSASPAAGRDRLLRDQDLIGLAVNPFWAEPGCTRRSRPIAPCLQAELRLAAELAHSPAKPMARAA